MSDCNGNCGECASKGSCERPGFEAPHALSNIKKVVAVVSGKGGVGKSLITSLLAVELNRRGRQTAILDADITGPSIPKCFGVREKAQGDEHGIFPVITKKGIKLMSINLMLENDDDPVIWRGPIIAGAVKQFWTDVVWDDVDYMLVDMPPGTGDVPLTVFQSIPLGGIIIATSPQELVSMIVTKAVNMAEKMSIPILGIVENYSYLECPDCKKKICVFGESHVDEVAKKHGLKVLSKIPIDQKLAAACDGGMVELANSEYVGGAADAIEKLQ